ncbi:MAG: hypothetical protein V3U75_00295 [Methylococcaceae bacterium]
MLFRGLNGYYKLPQFATRSGIKSQSSKGGGGFNEIRFEDKKGEEQVFLHAERNQDVRVKNDSLEWVGHDYHRVIGNDQFEQIEGNLHLTLGGDQNEEINGNISRDIAIDLQEKVGNKHALEAGTEIHHKAGKNVVIEAGESITLKAGGGFITIGLAGVTISGVPVLINSGGVAGSGSGCSSESVKLPMEADDGKPGDTGKVEKAIAKPAVTAKAASTPINRIAENRASSVDYWRDIEHDAPNFPEAFGARIMRLNAEAGHDIANGFSGLYDTLTDWDKFKALFQYLPNPKEIYDSLQETANEIQALPADKKGEGAYKLLIGGLATGGGGKLGASAGRQAGKKLRGVEGIKDAKGTTPDANIVPSPATNGASNTALSPSETLGDHLRRLDYDTANNTRIMQSIENGEQVVIVGENMKRVNAIAKMVDNAGGKSVTYTPRIWKGVSRNSLEANRSWIRYWAKDKGVTFIDIGRQPTPRPFGPSPYYGIENRSLNQWGVYTPFTE